MLKRGLWVLGLVGIVTSARAQSIQTINGPDVLRMASRPAPTNLWQEMQACVAWLGILPTKDAPPRIVQVATDRVVVLDPKTDSALGGLGVSLLARKAHQAYAMVFWDRIVLGREADDDVVRHEMLHFLVWRAWQRAGHPSEIFCRCDPLTRDVCSKE